MFRKILLPVFTVLVCALLIFSGQGVAVNQATAANTEATLVAFADLATAEPNLAFINYLVNQQVIAGFPDNTFRPGEPVTRAQAAALMVRAAGLETGVATATFSDVGSDHWATAVIAVAEQAGYLAGFPDGTFRPEEPITRAQGISLVLRLAKADLPVIPLPALDDMASNHWAAPSVAAGLDAGMVVLAAGNRFAPDNAFTRAEMSRALALGLTLSPGTREQPLSGRLVPREGTVKLKKAGETAYRVVEDEQLVTSGDQVQTGANSQAEILFPDGTGLLLKDRVHMGLEALRGLAYIQQNGQPGTAVDWLELDLQKGKIFFILSQSHGGQDVAGALPANEPDLITYQPANSKLAGQPLFAQLNPVPPAQVQTSTVPWWKQPQQQRVRLQVNMPFGVAGVRGTTGSVEVLADGRSEVRNLTGALGNLFVQSEDVIVNLAPAQFTVIVEKGTVEQAENMTAEQLADFAVEAVQEFLERQAEIADNVAVLALTAVAADLITQQETVQAALTEAATRAEEQPPAAPAAGGGGIGRDDDDDDDRDDRAARVTSVAISGLGIVGIPDKQTVTYQYTAIVKDQRGQVMAGEEVTWEEVTWSVQQAVYGVGVSFDNNNASVTVAVYAQEVTLELVAVSDTNEAVTATKQIIISTNPHQHINPAVIDIALPAPNVTGTLTIGEQPVTDARISFGRWETKDGERQLRWAGIGANTGTDGRFQTIILEPGSYQVRSIRDWDSGLDLDHSSLAEFTDTAFEITAGQTPVELDIDLPAINLTGQVRLDGQFPDPHYAHSHCYDLFLEKQVGEQWQSASRLDINCWGEFATILTPGDYRVAAVSVGGQQNKIPVDPVIYFEVLENQAEPVTVTVDITSNVSGKVVTAGGQPVADAEIMVEHWKERKGVYDWYGVWGMDITTAADGTFKAPFAPGQYRITEILMAYHHHPYRLVTLTNPLEFEVITANTPLTLANIVLPDPQEDSNISGTVTIDGQSQNHASVVIGQWVEGRDGWDYLDPVAWTRTNNHGYYQTTVSEPGQYQIISVDDINVTALNIEFTVTDIAESVTVDIAIPAVNIAGWIKQDGQRLDVVGTDDVDVHFALPGDEQKEIVVSVDRHGKFQAAFAPGQTYQLRGITIDDQHLDLSASNHFIAIPADQTDPVTIDINLASNVTGTVTVGGQTLCSGGVTFNKWVPAEQQFDWIDPSARIDAGNFRTILPETGLYQVQEIGGRFGIDGDWSWVNVEYLNLDFEITPDKVAGLAVVQITMPGVNSIAITGPATFNIPATGEAAVELQYHATAENQFGTPMPDEQVTWHLPTPVTGISIASATGTVTVTDAVYNTGIASFTLVATSVTDNTVTASETVTLSGSGTGNFAETVPIVPNGTNDVVMGTLVIQENENSNRLFRNGDIITINLPSGIEYASVPGDAPGYAAINDPGMNVIFLAGGSNFIAVELTGTNTRGEHQLFFYFGATPGVAGSRVDIDDDVIGDIRVEIDAAGTAITSEFIRVARVSVRGYR